MGQRSSAQVIATEQVLQHAKIDEYLDEVLPTFDPGIGGLGKLIDLNKVLNQRGIRSANPIASKPASKVTFQHIPHEYGQVFTTNVPLLHPARSSAGGVA